MASNILTAEARLENIKALALAAGISPEQAAERLEGRVLCTFDRDDAAAAQFYQELGRLLTRTIDARDTPDGGRYLVEVVVGDAGRWALLAPCLFGLVVMVAALAPSRLPRMIWSRSTGPSRW